MEYPNASQDSKKYMTPFEGLSVNLEPHWYAVYTCANHEKRVAQQFIERGVEHFLPLYSSVRTWSDRRVQVDLPLFPGYVFARFAMRERLRVLQVPSVVRLVGFNGFPTALQDEEIDTLRLGLASGLRAEPHPFLAVGRRVRVESGPLEGMVGTIARLKNGSRLVITLAFIERSIAIDVAAADLSILQNDSNQPRVSQSCGEKGWSQMMRGT